jgi:hypothetical protein
VSEIAELCSHNVVDCGIEIGSSPEDFAGNFELAENFIRLKNRRFCRVQKYLPKLRRPLETLTCDDSLDE